MIRIIQIFVITIFTSFFFFPFFFAFLPTINTKMFLAVLGLIAFAMDRLNSHTQVFEKGLFRISVWALGVSFCSFLTMTINNTPDDSYLGYIVSMWVWLFAAYFCVTMMRLAHGKISIDIIGYYLIAVALLQCTLGLLIYQFPFIKGLVDAYITGEKYMGVGVEERLYGIGCALDVGGGRLGAILIIIVYLLLKIMEQHRSKWLFIGLLSSFLYIFVIGNMMGRTASVGAVIAFVYFFLSLFLKRGRQAAAIAPYLSIALIVIGIGGILCIALYNISPEIRKLLRFGFEIFFNYFELGKFETHSTNMLSEGLIFPDNLKTWIIGDGYMASGLNDPYYTGPSDYGFYMNTDAGYSRFLFYFGLTGLLVFILFFVNVCKECVNKFSKARFLFIAIFILGLCIWIKVSTDLFLVFAPFLCLLKEESEDSDMKGSLEKLGE